MKETDLRLSTPEGCFVLRACAIILDAGRLLAAKDDAYYTVGGAVRLCETAEEAVVREVWEETGYRLEVDRLLYVQERIFSYLGVEHHEVAFYFLMKGGAGIPDGVSTDSLGEHLYWLPIEQLPKVRFVPEFLKTALQCITENVVHISVRE